MTDIHTAALKIDFVNARNGNKPASIKADGKYWSVKDEDFAKFKEGETVHVTYKAKQGTGQYAGRTFLDITGVVATETASLREALAGLVEFDPRSPQANGSNATRVDGKDGRITRLAFAKMIEPVPFSDRDTMCNQMTEIYLAAQDAFDRIFGDDEIPF